MKTSQNGINIIKKYESCQLKAYICPAGKPTIGYGHVLSTYEDGMTITHDEAERLLQYDLIRFEKSVDSINARLNQNQFDALVSLCFNIGPWNLKMSMLARRVKANPDDPGIASEFMKWVNAAGKKLNGLVKRREEESILYFTKI